MNKIAYHLNKEKTPSNTEGKFLYYYPCSDSEVADKLIYGKGYKVIEVTEEEWQTLIEIDRLEYNNWHKETRRHVPNIKELEHYITSKEEKPAPAMEKVAIENADKKAIFNTLSKDEQVVATMCIDDGYTQKEVAKKLGVTQGYISSIYNNVKYKLSDNENELDKDAIIWKSWNQFLEKGYCDNYFDFFVVLAIRQLDKWDFSNYVKWFFSIGEMLRHMARYSLFDELTMADDIKTYLENASFKQKERFVESYGDTFIPVQAMVCRMNMEMERRKSLQKGQLQGSSYQTLINTLNKIAKNKGISSDEYLQQYFLPDFIKKINKRYDNVIKKIQYLITKPKYKKMFK